MGIRELAGAVERQPNSVREQLDHLRAAGLVDRAAAIAGGRGRPAYRYAAVAGADAWARAPGFDEYRSLAAVLADQLASVPNAAQASITAGERWGKALARDSPAPDGEGAAVGRLLAILGEAGFEPERPVGSGPVVLRRCPFEPVARDHPGVVCGIHLGMIRGALDALGSTVDVVGLDPFVTPDACLAHLAPRASEPGKASQ